MKKLLATVGLFLATSLSHASGVWLLTGTQDAELDNFTKDALNKVYLPLVGNKLGENGGVYMINHIVYSKSKSMCVVSVNTIAGVDTLQGGGDITLFSDSPSAQSIRSQTVSSAEECRSVFKQALGENMKTFMDIVEKTL